ncbi:methylated-DNA--[protein]-cysteine S-methyltransferase [Robiginitalea sp. SC105]|uniref:methylated-DNA--[protein]-cysteine S-methyltransferase n=1 Tax=Robiginitalea sp. SC105 TaxID=2762332 RepID=UPI00163A5DEA|nr:methylated-DNA--[protein]-cysteine S-methyltransferase [Robiginitalea sp. SC105]MBC2838343.1 methylated-DNA--[protein]-cysteine S-methyltransferase [Robiginitalea sp. SC105]
MEQATLQTPLGMATILGDRNGIRAIRVTDHSEGEDSIPPALAEACGQLREYFNGERTVFDLPLAPEGTDFQQTVWQALLGIPYGKTISYMDLAKQLGDPAAIRAVAAANGKNPLWIVIPCHRVIGSDGSLTGYAGGIHRKKWLLNHESANPQQSLF